MSTDVTTTRRRNVVGLYQQFAQEKIAAGGAAKGMEQEFAAAIEVSPSMWSQIKNSRPISDNLARQIEHHMRRPPFWLDEAHPELAVRDEAEDRFIEVARRAWKTANAKEKRELARFLQSRPWLA